MTLQQNGRLNLDDRGNVGGMARGKPWNKIKWLAAGGVWGDHLEEGFLGYLIDPTRHSFSARADGTCACCGQARDLHLHTHVGEEVSCPGPVKEPSE
jgi:hypothetical protein